MRITSRASSVVFAQKEPDGAVRQPPQHLCVGEMVIRPTDTLSGRDGGSASALLACYGRPGMSKGAHSQSFECGVRPE